MVWFTDQVTPWLQIGEKGKEKFFKKGKVIQSFNLLKKKKNKKDVPLLEEIKDDWLESKHFCWKPFILKLKQGVVSSNQLQRW